MFSLPLMHARHPFIIKRARRTSILLCAAATVLLPAARTASQPEQTPDIFISIQPANAEQGSVIRISVSCPASVNVLSYRWGKLSAPLFTDSPGRWFGLAPVDMDHDTGTQRLLVTLRNAQGELCNREVVFEVIAKKFPEQHITVDENKVSLSAQDLERHNRERAQVTAAFAASQPRRLWSDAFILPVQGRISTPFGVRRFINMQPRNPHSGIDIAAPAGTPVMAASAGIVCLTGDHFFAGKSVYIDHGNAIFSMYFHLDSIDVPAGRSVARGDIIGRVGATGRSTGPHLHWGVRMLDTAADPLSLLALFD